MWKPKKPPGSTLLVVFVLIFVISSFLIIFVNAKSAGGRVKIVGVGAYWDRKCTRRVSTINWGMLEAGSTKSIGIYIKNEGNTPVTLLLNSTNWNPSDASKVIAVSWSYSGQALKPGRVIQVTLSLTVSSKISGINIFTFDITIYSFSAQ